MNIIEALKLAKEHGKKVRPVGWQECCIVFEKGVFLVKMSDVEYKYRLEIYSETIEPLILGEWEEATIKTDKRIIERKRKAIRQYCHKRVKTCEECYIKEICNKYQRKRCVLGELNNLHKVEYWDDIDVNESYQILLESGVY